MENETSKKRFARKWIVAAIVLAMVMAMAVLVPLTPVKTQAKARLTRTLVARLGPGAAVGNIDYGWRSVVLTDVTLPLDGHGSVLSIRRADIVIDPLALVRAPDQMERLIRSVRVDELVIRWREADRRRERAPGEPWLPRRSVPPALFAALSRFDSLRHVEIHDARILFERRSKAELVVAEFDGQLRDQNGALRLSGRGSYAGAPERTLSLTGLVEPRHRHAEVQLLLELPRDQNPLPALWASLPALSAGGGGVSLRAVVDDTTLTIKGSLSATAVRLGSPAGNLVIDTVRAGLDGDTLTIEPLTIASTAGTIKAQGAVLLAGAGTLQGTGTAVVPDAAELAELLGYGVAIQGELDGQFVLEGELANPRLQVKVGGDLEAYGVAMRALDLHATVERNRVRVESAALQLGELSVAGAGVIFTGRSSSIDLQSTILLTAPLQVGGWRSELSAVRIHAQGPLDRPVVSAEMVRGGGDALTAGRLTREGSQWICTLESPGLGASVISVEPRDGILRVRAEDAHRTLAALFPAWREALQPLARLEMWFEGGPRAGHLDVTGRMAAESNSVWTRLAREFHFDGAYTRGRAEDLTLRGNWGGTAGDGRPFEGQAELVLRDSVVTVDHFFVDVFGDIQGTVDLRSRTLDLELTVADLAADRLPLPSDLTERWSLAGIASGYVRARGNLARPEWTANLAVVDGSILGVPGYWANLEARGEAAEMEIQRLEIGRDVRQIVEVAGSVDLDRKQVAVTAELGAARAEDFLLALLGRSGILSGELNGRGVITGDWQAPDIEAEVSVRDGKLLGSLALDEFATELSTGRTEQGERVLRITRCEFRRDGKYAFSGHAAVVPRAGGALSAHVEGSGDFLDLLDQLDRSFRGEGSDGQLVADFGGTVDRPLFLGGELRLNNGRFEYAPAVPGILSTELLIQIGPDGDVEQGRIRFANDGQWIQVDALAHCDSTHPGLEPLIIPRPRLCLGVLQATTSDEGIAVRLPGFMKPEWSGTITAGADGGEPVTVSAYGPDRLLIQGGAQLSNARLTFPFLPGSGGRPKPVTRWLMERLTEAEWDLDVAVGSGNHYDVEITGLKNSEMFAGLRSSRILGTVADYLDHLSIDALVDPTPAPLEVRGMIDSSNFYLDGHLSSSRGRVEYLDQTFRIDYVFADFDGTNVMPVLEGRASTTGVDSLGRTLPVYLTMYQIDRETGTRQRRGRLDQITFVLESEGGETPEQVLQYLGYDLADAGGKAEQLVATTFARAIGRQWLDPLERRLERWTLLDEIALRPGGGRSSNLARQQRQLAQSDSLSQREAVAQAGAVRFLSGAQVTVGKYLGRDLFFTYTGELAEGQVELRDRLGLIHSWNLQYRMEPLSRDLVLDLAIEYDEIIKRRDESISVKYSFPLEP